MNAISSSNFTASIIQDSHFSDEPNMASCSGSGSVGRRVGARVRLPPPSSPGSLFFFIFFSTPPNQQDAHGGARAGACKSGLQKKLAVIQSQRQ
jgi:hypothetical protein